MGTPTTFRNNVGYAERKVEYVKAEAEQWFMDHREAEECGQLEDMICVLLTATKWLFDTDTKIHQAYCDGMPYQPELHDNLTVILKAWLIPAEIFDKLAGEFEAKKHDVVGAKELRRTAEEVRAILDPSEECQGEAEAEAIAAHRAGETFDWPKE